MAALMADQCGSEVRWGWGWRVERRDSLKLRVRLERAKLLVRALEQVKSVVVVVELVKLRSRSVSESISIIGWCLIKRVWMCL